MTRQAGLDDARRAAEEIARGLCDLRPLYPTTVAILKKALTETRDGALEEAAAVVERMVGPTLDPKSLVAEVIRALKEKASP